MERYARNGILSTSEQDNLWGSKALIVGAGGLGGYIFEMLTRVGIGTITIVDGDVFDWSNLNRQILSTTDNLGESKVEVASRRGVSINPDISIRTIAMDLTAENAFDIVHGHDLVFDALDSITDRIILHNACKKSGVPMVHGAIAGWMGQVAFIKPEDRTLEKLYPTSEAKGYEVSVGNPSFTPAIVAGLQVSEGIKYLTQKETLTSHQILSIDLMHHHYVVIDL